MTDLERVLAKRVNLAGQVYEQACERLEQVPFWRLFKLLKCRADAENYLQAFLWEGQIYQAYLERHR